MQTINLTRNSSTLRPLETNVQPRFYQFSSLSEHKHMCDQSIQVCLVSCFPQFVCVFTLLSVPSKKPSHALGIPIVSTTMPLDFQFKEPAPPPPPARGIHVGVGIFWNHPIGQSEREYWQQLQAIQ